MEMVVRSTYLHRRGRPICGEDRGQRRRGDAQVERIAGVSVAVIDSGPKVPVNDDPDVIEMRRVKVKRRSGCVEEKLPRQGGIDTEVD